MNKLVCKACRYCCSNEEQFTTHLKSKRHIKLTTPSSSSSENITIQIEEKEETEADTEIEEVINIPLQSSNNNNTNTLIETLLQQNQLMMKLLMEKQNAPAMPIAKENNRDNKFKLENYLNVTCKDAINFEDLFTRQYVLNSKYNQYIRVWNDELYLNELSHRSYPNCYAVARDFFCSGFNEIPHERKPIFCSDSRRGIFYVKTENKWVKMDKFDLSVKIFNKLFTHLFKIFMNVVDMDEDDFKRVYDKNYNTWYGCNKNELMVMICSIERDQMVHKLIPTLSKLCDKKYIPYKNEKPKEHTQETTDEEKSGSETETDEY